MGFLKLGLILLLVVRLLGLARYRSGGRGKPVTHDGETVRVGVTRNKSKNVIAFDVSVDVPDRLRFTLRRENWLDRVAKMLGVAREWQTGDEKFDSAVFIVSEDAVLLETMSADAQLRTLLMTLLQIQRGGMLECCKGRLTFIGAPADSFREVSDELAREQLARQLHAPLNQVRDQLARIAVGDWEADRDPALRTRGWFVGICALLGVAGIFGLFVELAFAGDQIVHDMIPYWSWRVVATLGAALVAGVLLWLRRTSHTHSVLLDILLVALPGAWFASYAALTWYNQRHDEMPAMRYAVRVESVYSTRHKGSTSYHLLVERWPDGRGEREAIIPEPEFMQLGLGNCVIVIWHPGRLGDSWISGFERAVAQDCYRENVE